MPGQRKKTTPESRSGLGCTERLGTSCGGRSGIRTHGGPKTSTAFEAVPFVRSGILPLPRLARNQPSRAWPRLQRSVKVDWPGDRRSRMKVVGSIRLSKPTLMCPRALPLSQGDRSVRSRTHQLVEFGFPSWVSHRSIFRSLRHAAAASEHPTVSIRTSTLDPVADVPTGDTSSVPTDGRSDFLAPIPEASAKVFFKR